MLGDARAIATIVAAIIGGAVTIAGIILKYYIDFISETERKDFQQKLENEKQKHQEELEKQKASLQEKLEAVKAELAAANNKLHFQYTKHHAVQMDAIMTISQKLIQFNRAFKNIVKHRKKVESRIGNITLKQYYNNHPKEKDNLEELVTKMRLREDEIKEHYNLIFVFITNEILRKEILELMKQYQIYLGEIRNKPSSTNSHDIIISKKFNSVFKQMRVEAKLLLTVPNQS